MVDLGAYDYRRLNLMNEITPKYYFMNPYVQTFLNHKHYVILLRSSIQYYTKYITCKLQQSNAVLMTTSNGILT